jgi:hypothetical protein
LQQVTAINCRLFPRIAIFPPGQKSPNNVKIKYQNAKIQIKFQKERNIDHRGYREMIVLKNKKIWSDFEL